MTTGAEALLSDIHWHLGRQIPHLKISTNPMNVLIGSAHSCFGNYEALKTSNKHLLGHFPAAPPPARGVKGPQSLPGQSCALFQSLRCSPSMSSDIWATEEAIDFTPRISFWKRLTLCTSIKAGCTMVTNCAQGPKREIKRRLKWSSLFSFNHGHCSLSLYPTAVKHNLWKKLF